MKESQVDLFVSLWVLMFLIGVYFLPTIVATRRDVVNKWSIAIINLFLGWTLLGWVVALAMSAKTKPPLSPIIRDQARYSALDK